MPGQTGSNHVELWVIISLQCIGMITAAFQYDVVEESMIVAISIKRNKSTLSGEYHEN